MSQAEHEKKTIQLTIDFPFEKYAYLKALADQYDISVQQYIIEFLCANLERERDLRRQEFKKAKEKLMKEDEDILRKLADS